MRVLVIGAGGVGSAFISITARREAFTHLVVADVDLERAQRAVDEAVDSGELDATQQSRLHAEHLDASDEVAVAALARSHKIDVVLNACDPRLNPPIFQGTFAANAHYVDMAMHLSEPHPTKPYEKTGRRDRKSVV